MTAADSPRGLGTSLHEGMGTSQRCSLCSTLGTAALVKIIEQGSGFGGGVYACPDCQVKTGWRPLEPIYINPPLRVVD